jgi:NCAIR mutase (PurE)-related protein
MLCIGAAWSTLQRNPCRRPPPAAAANGAASNQLFDLLQNVADGVLTAQDAAVQLNGVPGINSVGGGGDAPGAARADFPEVVWGDGKGPQQLATSLRNIAARQGMAAATRVDPGVAAAVESLLPGVTYNGVAHMLLYKSADVKQRRLPGTVAIISAGTADPRVVEECRLMLQATGCYCFKLPESGVMGMHRIVANLDAVRAADVVVCITGMDGGITSVVAAMVDCPVVALPTSTGYGTAFGGVAPLLAALNSSAPGVTVVNIDSGFGASMAAWRILRNASKIRQATMPQGGA